MQTHPALIERSVGATLTGFSNGRLTYEEAVLDLFELICAQINGKTYYSMAVIGYYVRAILKSLAANNLDLADAFDAFVDAAAEGANGQAPVTIRLARSLSATRH
ncbi:MAG TPA: hypothetical protein VLZ84_12230 [Asticcacaulis sp.]|nr:hypothetical protein [Asticcacaulis sp.]